MAEPNLKLQDDTRTRRFTPEFKLKAGFFLAGVSGVSALIGFGATLAAAKKNDPKYFGKGMLGSLELRESGAGLALRALGWGSLYAISGCGVLFYGIWKLCGASDLHDFRMKMGALLPTIKKNDPPVGRTEFSGMNDLLDYLQHFKGSRDK